MELVDNQDFLDWTVSDWELTWEARKNLEAKKPDPTEDYNMKYQFVSSPNGRGKQRLRTPEQVEQAIQSVYWFRTNHGMEDSIYSYSIYEEDYAYPIYNDYSMCSFTTTRLVDIYSQYISTTRYDMRTLQFYPLMDRLAEWIFTFYGSAQEVTFNFLSD